MNQIERVIAYSVLVLAFGFILWGQFDKAVNARVAEESAKVQKAADKKLSDDLAARQAEFDKTSKAKDDEIATARKSAETMAAYVNRQVPQAAAEGPQVGEWRIERIRRIPVVDPQTRDCNGAASGSD